MPVRIEPLTEDLSPAVAAFNHRLIEGGMSEFSFPEHPAMDWLPWAEGKRLYQRPFVAVDDGGIVRGGYILKRQDFIVAGERRSVGFLRLPLSEGVVNPTYASLGLKLVLHALRQSPMLFCLGMGSMERPLPRLLSSLQWKLAPVPFFFYVVRGTRFLRGMPAFRKRGTTSFMAMLGGVTGLGHIGLRAAQLARSRTKMGADQVSDTAVVDLQADAVWARSQQQYRFAAVRDSETIQALYGAPDAPFHRLEVLNKGVCVGWAVMLDTQMRGSAHFGDLRVATVVDCDAVPGHAAQVALAARNHLRSRGVDLIVTNQSHTAWTAAFSDSGFLSFSSNFIFAASKDLAAAIGPGDAYHLTRGDGDGPIHL